VTPLVLLALAVAAPVPKETESQRQAKWGKPALDAAGDSAKWKGDRLVFHIPKGTRGFEPDAVKDVTAPRTEQIVTGDFDLSVRVLGQTKTTPATVRVQAAVASGLYVRSKDAACLCYREWGAMTSDPGADTDTVSFRWQAGDGTGEKPIELHAFGDPYGRGQTELLMRIVRKDGKLRVYHGCENTDGVVWREAERRPTLKLPDEVTVGVFVRQSVDQETTAVFEDFKLERGAGRK
jgi:hypothetical protein